ncbi:hypothetical protein EYR38_001999 [Pleurotus pulmonarius]|nr:hypothetical protein EYR38_001999 [Pleurotus pulmonarius]
MMIRRPRQPPGARTSHASVSSAVASSSQTPAALPPANVLMKDLMKSIAIYLELPWMTHDDVDLVFQGQTVTVSAQNNEATYEWSTDLGGPVVIDSVRAGLADDQFRAVSYQLHRGGRQQ